MSNFYPPRRFELERINVRGIEKKDARGVFSIRNNLTMIQYSGIPQMLTMTEAVEFVRTRIDGMRNDRWLYWIIADKVSDELMGTICIFNFDDEMSRCDIGYELLPAYQGHGLVADAMDAVMTYCFDELAINKIYADINEENFASIQVVKRAGFNYVKDLNKGYRLFSALRNI